ncbi:uncharacterized protein LOC118278959 isoform X7 [Spodoptera frugiperda]|uniref:Uncharacterized protein LOC118278959 isoform X7 n=1 Tax=Spodoptera frugiperda TaxID=7108 RepID=A0A9R0DHZ5_SPOFR|nr:uncharacterized protein LOC118278959 isoform X7 [Spodoptera frugiperda]
MPRRRGRSNIGRSTVNARRTRSARDEESLTEREESLSQARDRYRAARERESSAEREVRRSRDRDRRRVQRDRESSIEREARLSQLRDGVRAARERESSAEREVRLTQDRDWHRVQRDRESARVTNSWTRAAAARRKNGKVVCPECNTDVDVEGRQGDKATAMLVNVYQYFATEGTKLSPSQLRERTALCTGASEEDVEHALGLYWSQTGDSDSQEAPSRKRRRVEEQPGDESHPLYVEVEVEAAEDEENGEEDPLTSEEEDIKPDITETCIQPVSQSSYIPVEDIKKETTEFEDGVS